MIDVVNFIIQTEISGVSDGADSLLEIWWSSELFLIFIVSQVVFINFIILSFLRIMEMDELEHLINSQNLIEFKRKQFYIFNYSNNKNVIFKKTFIIEIIAYWIIFLILVESIIATFIPMTVGDAVAIILIINFVIIVIYAIILINLFQNTFKKAKAKAMDLVKKSDFSKYKEKNMVQILRAIKEESEREKDEDR